MSEFHNDDVPPHSRKIGNIDVRFGSAAWQADIRKRGYAQGLEEGKKLAKAEAERWTLWRCIMFACDLGFIAYCVIWAFRNWF